MCSYRQVQWHGCESLSGAWMTLLWSWESSKLKIINDFITKKLAQLFFLVKYFLLNLFKFIWNEILRKTFQGFCAKISRKMSFSLKQKFFLIRLLRLKCLFSVVSYPIIFQIQSKKIKNKILSISKATEELISRQTRSIIIHHLSEKANPGSLQSLDALVSPRYDGD